MDGDIQGAGGFGLSPIAIQSVKCKYEYPISAVRRKICSSFRAPARESNNWDFKVQCPIMGSDEECGSGVKETAKITWFLSKFRQYFGAKNSLNLSSMI